MLDKYRPRYTAQARGQLPSDTHYVWWYDSYNSHNTGPSARAAEQQRRQRGAAPL